MLLAVLLNLPPFLAAYWAGERLPDDRNVIALWRILVGMPAFALWGLAVLVTACLLGSPRVGLAWVVSTFAGLLGWSRVKKLCREPPQRGPLRGAARAAPPPSGPRKSRM